MERLEMYFTEIRKVLFSKDFLERHRIGEKSFIRPGSKLGFTKFMLFNIYLISKSLNVALHDFFGKELGANTPTKQAFSLTRKKLRPEAFKELNDTFIQLHYNDNSKLKLFKDKYLLFAVDGSLVQLPKYRAISKHFGEWKNQSDIGMPMGRASVLYDVLNHQVIDAQLAPNEVAEDTLYKLHKKKEEELILSCNNPRIYLMDRKYISLDKLIEFQERSEFYVMRIRKSWVNEFRVFAAGDEDDAVLKIQIKNRKNIGKWVNDFEHVPDYINVRVVKIRLNTGEISYLATNLDFDIHELGMLYYLRWGVETYYNYLKSKFQLEDFSGKMVVSVLQDFFCKVFVANLAEVCITEAENIKSRKQNSTIPTTTDAVNEAEDTEKKSTK